MLGDGSWTKQKKNNRDFLNLGGKTITIFLESLFLISYLMLEKQGEMSRMAAETGS